MSVYVDDARLPYRGMQMSHLMADTDEELHAFAQGIGLARRWFQAHPLHPHYDVSEGKRALALRQGARAMTRLELARWNLQRRGVIP